MILEGGLGPGMGIFGEGGPLIGKRRGVCVVYLILLLGLILVGISLWERPGRTESTRDWFRSQILEQPGAVSEETIQPEASLLSQEVQARTETLQHLLSRAERAASDLQKALESLGSTPERTPAQPGRSRVTGPRTRYQWIYRLSENGMKPAEIAQRTGMTTGEVELILNLGRTREPARELPMQKQASPARRHNHRNLEGENLQVGADNRRKAGGGTVQQQ